LERDWSKGIRNIGGIGVLGVGSEVKDGTGRNKVTVSSFEPYWILGEDYQFNVMSAAVSL